MSKSPSPPPYHTRSRFVRLLVQLTSTLVLAVALANAAGAQSRLPGSPQPSADASFESLVGWLAVNPGHSGFAEALDRAVAAMQTVPQAEQLASVILADAHDGASVHGAIVSLGGVLRTARRFERAITLYEAAYFASAGADLHSLFLQAQLLLETGSFAASEQRARTVVAQADDYELKRRAYALVARLMHVTGRSAEALQLLDTLAALDDPEFVEPDTLLVRHAVRIATASGGESSIERLRRLHPESIAVLQLDHDRIEPAPLPSALLLSDGGPLASAATAGPPSSDDGSSAQVTAIQIGSFSDRDNAEHQAADLQTLGLDGRVVEERTGSRTLYRVLVSVPDGRPSEATRILGILRNAGLDGFMLY